MSWPLDGSSSRGRLPLPRSPNPQPPLHGLPGSRGQFFFGGHTHYPGSLSVTPTAAHGTVPSSQSSLLSPILYLDHESPSSSSQGSTSSTGLASGSSPSRMGGPVSSSRPYKVCGVCGDRAKSYHFGGISCDSCKAFFRRSVQNEAFRNFHCPYDGRCEITIGSRKCCQYCRFQKCLSIGMEKGWVMTEEERMQLLKNRMEKKQRERENKSPLQTPAAAANLPSIPSTSTASTTATEKRRNWKASSGSAGGESSGSTDHETEMTDLSKYLNNEDVDMVEGLVNAYETSYRVIPLVPKSGEPSRTDILELFFTVIKQFAHFARQLSSFDKLPASDQEALLRCGVLELCFLRGVYVFDERNLSWTDKYRDTSIISSDDLRKLVSAELRDKHLKFVASVKDMEVDEPTIMMLLAIVLLSPDRPGLVSGDIVSREQERYYTLLRRYMTWRYGVETTAIVYPKLLLKLPDLRELSDAHTDFHLNLEKEEMEEIQQRLSVLRVEPQSAEGHDPLPSAGPTWSLRSYLASLIPSSPGSLEDESCSSDSSERMASYRVPKDA